MDSRHPYGGLSTGTLQYLCLKTDDVFKRLQESVEKAVEPRGEVLKHVSRLNLRSAESHLTLLRNIMVGFKV